MLLTDVGQKHHIIKLALAHRPLPPSAKPTRCDLHNPAEKLYWPNFFPSVYEGEPQRLWPAKKIAAFLALPSYLINWVAPVQNWSHCPSGYL
jgi:hypothetical protein